MDDDAARVLAWAEWLGSHAVPVFSVVLVALLLVATMVLVVARRYGGRMVVGHLSRTVLLSICLVVGAGMLMAMAAVFAEMMEVFQADEEIGLFDSRLTETLSRELSASTLRVFGTLTHLGDPITLTLLVVVIAVLLLVRRQVALAFGWAVACAGGAVLNRVLKQIFERVRPEHDHGFAVADGYSFPSGHTSGAVVVYGMLAYLCIRLLPSRWHVPAVLLATAFAFSTGWSRVFLQVHWASDVVAGFASGLSWLTVCIVAMEIAQRNPRT
ncbi:phosphatase PAP2 family protein [Hydrogenophaga sp.]|uniref:phosphatase PAP2 family protein n=1 Tax=Hydrogenophaga sp. TaxID=1904254 RepID=UPI003F72018B